MKNVFMLMALVFCSQFSFAQEEAETQTMLGKGIDLTKLGFMVSPGFQVSKVAGENVGFYQFKGGLVFNDKVTVGGFYGESTNEIRPLAIESGLPASANVDLRMGGGFVEYTLFSHKMFHLTFPFAVGILEMEGDDYGRGMEEGESRKLFLEPSAQLELNLHQYARLHAGIAYRLMTGSGYSRGSIPDADNSINFQVGLKIGMFSFKN